MIMIPLSDITDEVIPKWNKICDERKPKCKCGKNAISHMDVCEDCYYEQLGNEQRQQEKIKQIEAKIKKAKQKLIKELTKSGCTEDEITEIINKRFDT